MKEAIRLEKFNSRSRVERVAELEGLLAVVEVRLPWAVCTLRVPSLLSWNTNLQDGVKKLDKDTALLTAPVEKLRRLLTSTDKKAMARSPGPCHACVNHTAPLTSPQRILRSWRWLARMPLTTPSSSCWIRTSWAPGMQARRMRLLFCSRSETRA